MHAVIKCHLDVVWMCCCWRYGRICSAKRKRIIMDGHLFMKHALNGSPFEGNSPFCWTYIWLGWQRESNERCIDVCFSLYVFKYASDIHITRRKKEIVRYVLTHFLYTSVTTIQKPYFWKWSKMNYFICNEMWNGATHLFLIDILQSSKPMGLEYQGHVKFFVHGWAVL